jgi:N-acetyl-anhydromuramyl-L-alanine amidase AmpD
MPTPSKPVVVSTPSPNHGYDGAAFVPQAVVWHITQGASQPSIDWLCNPASDASANYVIRENGQIVELVNPDAGPQGAAWANGIVNHPDTGNALVASWVAAGINPNLRSVSIEHAGFTSNNHGGSLTAAQVDATVRLTAWLCAHFGIAPDQEHILGHYQLDDVNRHYCPGFSAAEWAAWLDRVAALVAPAPSGPMLSPVVTPQVVWGATSKGRLIAQTVTVVNDDTGKYYEAKIEYRAAGPVQLPWREV